MALWSDALVTALKTSNTWQQFAVILGPIIIGAVLGPALFALMKRAKKRTDVRRPELSTVALQHEANDLVTQSLRTEVKRLSEALSSERDTCKKHIATIATQEKFLSEATVVRAQLAAWLDIVGPTLYGNGHTVPPLPRKVKDWLESF